MTWVAAMVLAGALLLATGDIRQKAKAWAGLICAWALGVFAVGLWGFYPPPVAAFMVIDATAATIVLSRPRQVWQQLIGAIFAVMLAWHIGFLLTDMSGVALYLQVQLWLGWIQWGVLMLWGGFDAGKAFGIWAWSDSTLAAHSDNNGAGRS